MEDYLEPTFSTNLFLAEGEDKFPLFDKWEERGCEEDYGNMFDLLQNDIIPNIFKINNLLVQRGLYSIHEGKSEA